MHKINVHFLERNRANKDEMTFSRHSYQKQTLHIKCSNSSVFILSIIRKPQQANRVAKQKSINITK
jgi:hypothetical protein